MNRLLPCRTLLQVLDSRPGQDNRPGSLRDRPGYSYYRKRQDGKKRGLEEPCVDQSIKLINQSISRKWVITWQIVPMPFHAKKEPCQGHSSPFKPIQALPGPARPSDSIFSKMRPRPDWFPPSLSSPTRLLIGILRVGFLHIAGHGPVAPFPTTGNPSPLPACLSSLLVIVISSPRQSLAITLGTSTYE